MSSDTLARVEAFRIKADELADKGHILRAVENYGRAAEAARALGADNLVALHMLALQGSMVGCNAVLALEANDADARICAAHRAESVALLSGVLEALERRRVADTLLEGKCTAAEEAWRVLAYLQTETSAAEAASWAVLVGYEEFLNAAMGALGALGNMCMFASEFSGDQRPTFVRYIVRAAELMQQPRCHGDAALRVEVEFTDAFRRVSAAAGAFGLDARFVQLLAGAWQRIQRSGVLQARHINDDEQIQEAARGVLEFGTAVLNSRAAPGLRRCALPGCGAKEAHPAHFKSCAACRTVVYCCREHQVVGWPTHKKACKAARKTQAEDDGAGPSGA